MSQRTAKVVTALSLAALLAFTAQQAIAKPTPPALGAELAPCQARHGVDPVLPMAPPFEGLSPKGSL